MTREQNSWSTGASSRSTSNVSRGPAENCASTSSLPSGSEPSTTCANLSSLAVSLSPSFDVKKSNGSEDPLLSSSEPDYIAEYVGYKARRPAAIRATPQVRRAGLFADDLPRTSWPSGIIGRRTREARGIAIHQKS